MSDLWKAVLEFYSQSDDLKAWIESEEVENKLEYDETFRLELLAILAYEGFDPVKVIQTMLKARDTYIATKGSEEKTVEFVINGTKKTFKWKGSDPMISDIKILLALFAYRGCTWKKIWEKSNLNMSDVLRCMTDKYEINVDVRAAGTTLQPDVVTLARIAACFPVLVCEAYFSGIGKRMFAPAKAGLDESSPKVLWCPLLVSMIPKCSISTGAKPKTTDPSKSKASPLEPKIATNIHPLLFLIHVIIDDTIHRKEGDYTDLKDMLTYYMAAWNTPASPFSERKKALTRYKMLDAGNIDISDEIKAANTGACQLIRDYRPDDADLEEVIGDLITTKNFA